MSDGPHKSLDMCPGWRKLAERASLPSFELAGVAEAISVALGDDWRRDRCDTLIKQLGEAFSDKQGKLFEPTNEENVEKLRDINGAGYPLRRLILECVTQEFEHGATVSDA